jgi:Ser/Thr protein kinase RdoA (MazF antagonist)
MIPVPETVLAGLAAAFGLCETDLARFAGGNPENDGVIFAYAYADRRRLLKIIAIPAADRRMGRVRFLERLRFMRFLGENGARIAFPALSPQGDLYESVDDGEHLWVAYTMEVAPGKGPAQDAWDVRFFRRWGETVGQMHRLAQAYPSWRSSTDPKTGKPFLTWRSEWDSFRDWCQDDEVKRAWEDLRERLEDLPVTRDAFGFIHNDPHIWNLRYDGNRITVLDFDVANHHWFMTDIGIVLQSVLIFHTGGLHGSLRDREKLLAFLTHFVKGYERENQLSAAWWNRLDLFIAYRRILLFIVMYDWARSRANLHASWRRMILAAPEVLGSSWFDDLK